MSPFDVFPKSAFDVIAPNGVIKYRISARFSKNTITIEDMSISISNGDEIRRVLPNGTEEVFNVTDVNYHQAFHAIPERYEISIVKKGVYPKGTGGNYSIHVHGANSRVNISSTDNSINHSNDADIFWQISQAVTSEISTTSERDLLLSAIAEMSETRNDKIGFLSSYQKFIAGAANHMTIVAPFLPALIPFLQT